jgi:hypothetical protein
MSFTGYQPGMSTSASRLHHYRESRGLAIDVVYGGETSQQRSTARLLGWRDMGKILFCRVYAGHCL